MPRGRHVRGSPVPACARGTSRRRPSWAPCSGGGRSEQSREAISRGDVEHAAAGWPSSTPGCRAQVPSRPTKVVGMALRYVTNGRDCAPAARPPRASAARSAAQAAPAPRGRAGASCESSSERPARNSAACTSSEASTGPTRPCRPWEIELRRLRPKVSGRQGQVGFPMRFSALLRSFLRSSDHRSAKPPASEAKRMPS